ncbi:CHRNN [Mytilus coruscus]|uniref:CHRNN n=1 Tax=Mytilus coruscus TaxID=42192 RepID=A0A6J8CHE3_MYTCO|nr:CHRNN [Mytilus coruscus]
MNDVRLLKNDLFHNYDRQILPIVDMNTPVNVSIYFQLLSVYELDLKNQLLSTSAAFKISWRDELMIWNTANYSGLDRLTVTLASIWKPDVIILNSESTKKTLTDKDDDNHFVTVNYDGFIEWWIYVNLQTHCKVNMTNYPFETQKCDINVTKSYLDDESEILQSVNDSSSIENLVTNGEWEVFPLRSSEQIFHRSNREISGLKWTIEMKRETEFYIWNFLMPSISLSVADWFSFWLPTKSAEKLTLSIFVFLANAVLIRLFNDSMPTISDDISKFGRLLWITLLLSGLVILVNVIITSLFYCKSPKCIFTCCNCCTDCCKCKCFTKCCKKCTEPPRDTDRKPFESLRNGAERNQESALITHRDVSITIKEGIDQTFIHHRGMKIQLGTITSYYEENNKRTDWSDVSRNIDFFASLVIFALYTTLYIVHIFILDLY